MKSSLLAIGLATTMLSATVGQTALAQDNPAAGAPAATPGPGVTTPPAPAATPPPPDAAAVPAAGQASPAAPPPTAGAARTGPPPGPAAARPPAAPAAPALAGTWVGQVAETGHPGHYPVKIIITALAAASDYPDQNCAGKLTRIGASGKYVFFSEKIAVGAYDEAKGTGCIDGTLTLVRSGNNLLLAWVGEMKGEMIVATGTLTPQTPGGQKPPANVKQTPAVTPPPPVAQTTTGGQRPATSLKPPTGKP